MFTFIVTTYNYDKYIGECLKSIIRSNQNFNNPIVVIDDGSTDKTHDELFNNGLLNYIDYIRIENVGVEKALTLALEEVKTEYFVRIDADDSITKDFTSVISETIKSNDNQFYYSNYFEINSQSELIKKITLPTFDKNEIYSRGDFLATGTVINVSSFNKAGGYHTNIKNCGLENYSLILRMIESGFQGKHINKFLFYYRRHNKSMSLTKRNAIINYGKKLLLDINDKDYKTNIYHPYQLKL
tara:strand:+ start:4344 stop:5069 length:726 start_codon:yes stop_codon:yes gene_type:complete